MKFIEPVYRPPQEAESLLLPVMQSCTWNKCNFCYRLKDYPLRIAEAKDFEEAVITEKKQNPYSKNIFLVGSNAFAIPLSRFRQYFNIIRKYIPDFNELSMFARVDAIAAKTDEELMELKNLGVNHLYVGTESGNDDALALMNKGHSSREALDQLKRLDKAGIAYTLFYIIGLGGKGKGLESAIDTAALFNAAHPRRISSTGMTVTEGTGAWDLEAQGKYVQASEREKIEELRAFLENLHVDTFYDGIHMLNPLHFRFQVSDEESKRKILSEIDRILNSYTDSELENAINRPAMAEMSKAPKLRAEK